MSGIGYLLQRTLHEKHGINGNIRCRINDDENDAILMGRMRVVLLIVTMMIIEVCTTVSTNNNDDDIKNTLKRT